jgi:hypothetical protein
VGDCPNTLFFERDGQRGFHDFLPFGREEERIVDWQDSLVQAIDLAWRLGFRRLLLVGCDLHVRPPEWHRTKAEAAGVRYQPEEPLRGFYDRCRQAGIAVDELASADPIQPYHFDETKSLAAAQQTDFHYFRVVQSLRLCRRAMALAGLELISATPGSRLNPFFSYRPADDLLDELEDEVGSPARETTRGQYGRKSGDDGPAMKDFRPHNWPKGNVATAPPVDDRGARLRRAVEELPEEEVRIEEEA